MLISEFLQKEEKKEYYTNLQKRLDKEYQEHTIYPSRENIFKTFELCKEPKVVILGQDPYINPGEAHGIAFSVYDAKLPPSLKNIFKELESDLGIKRQNGNLSDWCKEGVLLFNTVFTVRAKASLSHKNIGWEQFSKNLIEYLDENYKLVFVLWGNNAKSHAKYIKNGEIIESVHPSPLSARRGFFNSKPFSKVNQKLKIMGISEVNWNE